MNPTPRPQQQHQQPQHHRASAPGRMTAVMRTLTAPTTAQGPRIPRIAVVRGGRIIDEILVKEGSASGVTIGSSEKARIVVQAPQLPQVFLLIERNANRYFLRFSDAMTGRVSGVNGISALADLKMQAERVGDGTYRVPLSDDARGKVSLGDTTFLFQIVAPPPPALRPQLPIGVKHGLGLDWGLTIIAAFSFLIHFGVAGAMYSDWLDPVITTDHVVSGMIDTLNHLPKPPPEVPLDPQTVDPTNPTPAPVANNNNSTTPTRTNNSNNSNTKRSTTTATSNHSSSQSASDRQAAALAAQAEQMQVDYLTVKSQGSSVRDALRDGVPPVDMSSAAEKNVGVAHNSSDLRIAHGGPVATGKSNLPGVVGNNTQNTANTKSGNESNTTGPSITVGTQPAIVNGIPISDADAAVAKLRPRFKRCYQEGLNSNPNMSGKAVLVAKVGPNGEVMSTDIASNEGLSSAVTSCLTSTVTQHAQFTGNNSVTTVRIPVSLIRQ